MTKSKIYQILILVVIFLILSFTYYNFYNNKNISQSSNDVKNSIETEFLSNTNGSQIQDIYYISTDKNGNSYEINSENAEIFQEDVYLLKLSKVSAIIKIKGSGIIKINSGSAIYNKNNLNTYFYNNVRMDYNEHKITSEDIDMNFENKNIKVTGNVNYINNKSNLNADIVEMDLLTKISKIYMKNKTDKIKANIIN